MNWTDITIIYLACGAPFAVYFYLSRNDLKIFNFRTIFFSILILIFWFPLSIYFLFEKNYFKRLNKPVSFEKTKIKADEEKLQKIIKQFEKIYFQANPNDSIFDFREILERYAGLSSLMQSISSEIADHEKEIFKISGKSENDLSHICLNRRNRKRLYFHQNSARQDFLQSLTVLFHLSFDKKTLGNLALKFTELLNDDAAQTEIEKIIGKYSQTERKFSATHLEKDLWKPETQKQPSHAKISIPLPTLRAKLNSSIED